MQRPIDGHNIWTALSWDTASPRSEVLCNLDEDTGYSSLVRNEWKLVNGSTSNGVYDAWISAEAVATERHESFDRYGESVLNSTTGRALAPFSFSLTEGFGVPLGARQVEQLREQSVVGCKGVPMPSAATDLAACSPLVAPCLFNVLDDPCERRNLAVLQPSVVAELTQRVNAFRRTAVKPRNRVGEERSNPKYFNGTWTWWYDELGLADHSNGGGGVFQHADVSVWTLWATFVGCLSSWIVNA